MNKLWLVANPSERPFFDCRGTWHGSSAIVRALRRNGYGNPAQGGELLTPSRKELNLLNDSAVRQWMIQERPDVVVLAAATVGGIEANRSRPADFLLENLRIETQVIEAAWRAGADDCFFRKQLHLPKIRRAADSRRITSDRPSRTHKRLVRHRQDRRNKALRALRLPTRL